MTLNNVNYNNSTHKVKINFVGIYPIFTLFFVIAGIYAIYLAVWRGEIF